MPFFRQPAGEGETSPSSSPCRVFRLRVSNKMDFGFSILPHYYYTYTRLCLNEVSSARSHIVSVAFSAWKFSLFFLIFRTQINTKNNTPPPPSLQLGVASFLMQTWWWPGKPQRNPRRNAVHSLDYVFENGSVECKKNFTISSQHKK